MNTTEHVPITVVGGGQAGLATSYQLGRLGLTHVVLDASDHAGDTWRHRWDSLRLFTPARIDHLDGLPFPRAGGPPSKDEFADYLDRYERELDLPVRHGVRVTRLSPDGDGFSLETSAGTLRSDVVVIAMSSLQVPHVPGLAATLDPAILSLHSAQYRNPGQLREGAVLVVGVGNTGAEIAVEVAGSHQTWLAGRESGHLPFRIDGRFGQVVASRVIAFAFLHVLTTDTPIGRKAQPVLQSRADPLLRERPKDFREAGVLRVPRIIEVREGRPVAEDGTVLDVANVIWCTGFGSGLTDWVDLPVFDEHGRPRQARGIVDEQPRLYFVGQDFQFAKASESVPGVSRDARHVAEHIAAAIGPPQGAGRGTSGRFPASVA
jgi:putative flavoprotein involved in K+ transport